jgi:hypothetical protein
VVHIAPLGRHVATGEHASPIAQSQDPPLRRGGEPGGATQPEGLATSVDEERLQVGVAGEHLGDLHGKGLSVERAHTCTGLVVDERDHHHRVRPWADRVAALGAVSAPNQLGQRSRPQLPDRRQLHPALLVFTPRNSPLT